jgi:preprotein translocase subunit SecE
VARNRKRAKERRARRPTGASVSARNGLEQDAAPDPIEHAAPDVELAEAQLALGRPDLSSEAPEDRDEDELEFEREAEAAAEAADGGAGGSGGGFAGNGETPGAVAVPASGAPAAVGEHRPGLIGRLVNFLQGSWHELQRVQWPDRRQVMQATGVVIGFVIVAGVFLGVADFLSTKLMNYILTGHFK